MPLIIASYSYIFYILLAIQLMYVIKLDGVHMYTYNMFGGNDPLGYEGGGKTHSRPTVHQEVS